MCFLDGLVEVTSRPFFDGEEGFMYNVQRSQQLQFHIVMYFVLSPLYT